MLYGLMLDRMGLSVRSGWLDSNGRVYIYFTLEDALAMLGCGKDKAVRVNQEDVPTTVVRSRFLKLDREHILYVMESMQRNTTQVGNIRAYTLSALYNAPATISPYYVAQVSHDMAQAWGDDT